MKIKDKIFVVITQQKRAIGTISLEMIGAGTALWAEFIQLLREEVDRAATKPTRPPVEVNRAAKAAQSLQQ
jgi:hypothetical protein